VQEGHPVGRERVASHQVGQAGHELRPRHTGAACAEVGQAVAVEKLTVAHRGDLCDPSQNPSPHQLHRPPGPRRHRGLGRAGYPALGIAYGIIGMLIVSMAATYRPDKKVGFDAALTTLAARPYGTALLLLVAAGLACFGLYCLFDARYRRG
jgi:hypothetical protein